MAAACGLARPAAPGGHRLRARMAASQGAGSRIAVATPPTPPFTRDVRRDATIRTRAARCIELYKRQLGPEARRVLEGVARRLHRLHRPGSWPWLQRSGVQAAAAAPLSRHAGAADNLPGRNMRACEAEGRAGLRSSGSSEIARLLRPPHSWPTWAMQNPPRRGMQSPPRRRRVGTPCGARRHPETRARWTPPPRRNLPPANVGSCRGSQADARVNGGRGYWAGGGRTAG